MPSTTALTWPSVAEIAAVANCMAGDDGAYMQIEGLKEAFGPLVNLDIAPSVEEGVEPLTLETLAALASTLAKARFDLEYALGSIRTLELQRDMMALEIEIGTRAEGSDDA